MRSSWTTKNCSIQASSTTAISATTISVSRPWHAPTSCAWTVKSLKDHNKCSCVLRLVFTKKMCSQLLKPTTSCLKVGLRTLLQPSSMPEHRSLKCHLVSCSPWKKTASKASTILWNLVRKFHNLLAVLVCLFTTSALLVLTLKELTEPLTVSFQCSAYSTILHVTLTKVVVSAKDLSLFISNHGMPMSSIFLTSRKTTVKKSNVLATFSMRSGFQTYSWSVSKKMANGPSCVHTNVRVFLIHTAQNSKHFIPNTSKKEKDAKPSKHKIFGLKSLSLKLRRVHHTCCIKMLQTPNLINRTLVRSSLQTFVQKLSSTLHLMRWLFVTWHHWRFLSLLLKKEPLTTTNFSK